MRLSSFLLPGPRHGAAALHRVPLEDRIDVAPDADLGEVPAVGESSCESLVTRHIPAVSWPGPQRLGTG